jgi:NAD-dependent SIR2 family protein deacetylase
VTAGIISDCSVPLPEIPREKPLHCPTDALVHPTAVMFGEPTTVAITGSVYNFTSSGSIDILLVIGTCVMVLSVMIYIPDATLRQE